MSRKTSLNKTTSVSLVLGLDKRVTTVLFVCRILCFMMVGLKIGYKQSVYPIIGNMSVWKGQAGPVRSRCITMEHANVKLWAAQKSTGPRNSKLLFNFTSPDMKKTQDFLQPVTFLKPGPPPFFFFLNSRRRLRCQNAMWFPLDSEPRYGFPNWNRSPQNAAQQHNAAICRRCARHMQAGSVYRGPMFYLARVRRGGVHARARGAEHLRVSNGGIEVPLNSSRSPTWLMNFGRPPPTGTPICRRCFHTPVLAMGTMFNSSRVTEPCHTRLSKKKKPMQP